MWKTLWKRSFWWRKGRIGVTCYSTEEIYPEYSRWLKKIISNFWVLNGSGNLVREMYFPSPQTWCQVSAHGCWRSSAQDRARAFIHDSPDCWILGTHLLLLIWPSLVMRQHWFFLSSSTVKYSLKISHLNALNYRLTWLLYFTTFIWRTHFLTLSAYKRSLSAIQLPDWIDDASWNLKLLSLFSPSSSFGDIVC